MIEVKVTVCIYIATAQDLVYLL